MAKTYRLVADGMQARFHDSRSKVQFIGGGFGNGKTAAVCVKALRLAKDYPGSNGLIARSTYPKLNDTIRKEFLSWCPKTWIKRMPTKDDNTAYLTNGSSVNFRYVSQKGSNTEATTSNLLSATYDWIIVDQMEDPEFVHKDFMDLMGRLRGNTTYTGDDVTMPREGPRWFMGTLNPTRNWCYREIIKPLHDFHKGIKNDKLLCVVDSTGAPVIVNDLPIPLIELFEGSTYENVENVGEDYINGMLSTFTGTMRERFVFGKWGALSGLVYPQYDEPTHFISHTDIVEYLRQMRRSGYTPEWIEGYDHGLRVPSCYGLSFVDDDGNVFLLDGFYNPEQLIATSAAKIEAIRDKYGLDPEELHPIWADPALFKRTAAGGGSKVGVTVAGIFDNEHNIKMQPGANGIEAGIAKVSQYLTPMAKHEHPITGMTHSPHLFVSDRLDWWNNEITEYYWKKDGSGEETDTPTDRNDHAMDMTKYLLSSRPKLAKFTGRPDAPPQYLSWHEIDRNEASTLPRHR